MAACHPQGAAGRGPWMNTGDGFPPEPAGISGSRGEGHLAPDDLLGYQLTIWPKIHQCGWLRVGLTSNKQVGTGALCSGVILRDSRSSLWTDANGSLVENHSNAPDLSSTSQSGDKAPSDPLEPIFKCPRTNRVPEPNGPPSHWPAVRAETEHVSVGKENSN